MDVHVSLLDRRDIAGQIHRQLRRLILDGDLRSGDPLPPTRDLAAQLQVSRTTVLVAYDRLAGEGFVWARTGSGTFVSDAARRPSGDDGPPAGVLDRRRSVPPDAGIDVLLQTPRLRFDLRCGVPDDRLFPFGEWRGLVAGHLRRDAELHAYGTPAGHPVLREAIARHIAVTRAVRATAADVIVTNGIQQAVDLVARTLLAPGDVVAVEDPGYPPQRVQFAQLGARVVGVPVDEEGIVVSAIPQRARLVVVTPSHQFPTGVVLSLRRRIELLEWAGRNDVAIVEDDYDSEFRFGGRPIEPLQNLNARGRVIYTGSFSKTMLPSLRLGFLVAPPSVREGLVAAKFAADWSTPMVSQLALASFIDSGRLGRHLRRMRKEYGARHEQVSLAVREDFRDVLELLPSEVGMHVTGRLLAGRRSADVARAAAGRGVGLYPLAPFAVGGHGEEGLILGYGALARADVGEAMARLRLAVADVPAAS